MNQVNRLNLARAGQDVTIWGGAKVLFPEVISIGDSVIIDDFVFIMGGKATTLGSFIHIASFTSITGGGELIMEDFTTLSSGIRVFTGNDDYLGGSLTGSGVPYPYRLPTRSFVHIRKHSIVGANSVILPGVTIGEGVAIGANSLVKHDCEPWMIYAGSPARILRPRPKEKILELETQLRRELYDRDGNYIPKDSRPVVS
ncbi:acyltransferase [Pannus brasiliensis CCIBt3594]|uniref:Chloramphenicol acetyltransferase n=1 Tax=Pannus brasiliensis CCIBt3594 TaxID=1427578 RepID=A0AAW9QRR3_9CHRO